MVDTLHECYKISGPPDGANRRAALTTTTFTQRATYQLSLISDDTPIVDGATPAVVDGEVKPWEFWAAKKKVIKYRTGIDGAEAERLYVEEHKTTYEIAEILGCSQMHISQRLRHRGVKMRYSDPVPVKEVLVCRACGAEWRNDEMQIKAQCPFCGKTKWAHDSKRYRPSSAATYFTPPAFKDRLSQSHEKVKSNRRRGARLNRKRAFFKIQNTIHFHCERCGCDDIRLLEINHKNGGGSRQDPNRGKLLRDIIQNRRSVDDLELLCRPCNALHYLEMKYGPLPMLKVVWTGGPSA